MELATNLVLIPNRFAMYGVMNELVTLTSKKQPTISLFIL